MKNNVSHGVAKELKELGFPQPKPELGQFWFQTVAAIVCNRLYTNNGVLALAPISRVDFGMNFESDLAGEKYFAPTAADILQELGPGFYIESKGDHFACGYYYPDNNFHPELSYNSADAAAKMWIKIDRINKRINPAQ